MELGITCYQRWLCRGMSMLFTCRDGEITLMFESLWMRYSMLMFTWAHDKNEAGFWLCIENSQIRSPCLLKGCCAVFFFFSSGEKRLQTTKNESVVNLNCLFQSPYIGRWTLLGREVAVSWQWKTRLCEAESLAVWVFWICVILSPCSGKLGNRCQRNLILEMGKKKKKELR